MSQSVMSLQGWVITHKTLNQRFHWPILNVNASHLNKESQADWLNYMIVIKTILQTLMMKVYVFF